MKNPTVKMTIVLISTAYNFVIWLVVLLAIWKAGFVYKNGTILIAFNNYGELYIEFVIILMCFLSIIPIGIYISKEFIKKM